MVMVISGSWDWGILDIFVLSLRLILMADFDKDCIIAYPKFGLKWVSICASLVCD